MVKLIVLYGHPQDPAGFEAYYAGTHMPLAELIPNVARVETAKAVASPDGGQPPYYRTAELWFEDLDTLNEALASEPGQAAAADIANFATGGATLFTAELD